MATIEYSVAGQQIVVTKDEKLVENTIGIYTVGFTFDAASWGDFTQKTAVFVHEDYPDTPPYEVPIDDGEAPIPAAVLKYGNIMIGVYGSTQTQQYPTIWAPAKRVWPGAGPGVEPPEDPVFGMVVRTAPQELTEEQQEIARTNIGAAPEVVPDSTPGNITVIGSNGNIEDGGHKFSDAFPVGSASGAVATFSDGADNVPVKSMTVQIEPVQAGSGDPSPSNVRTITGWTQVTVTRTGVSSDSNIYEIEFPSEAGTVYGGELTVNEDGTGTLTKTMDIVKVGDITWKKSGDYFRSNAKNSVIKANSPAYCSMYPVDFESPISDGYIGVGLTAVSSSYYLMVRDSSRSSMTAADWKSAFSDMEIVYTLATPVTYELTAPQVRTMLGLNNIWSDTGDIAVEYHADPTIYVSEKTKAIKETIAYVQNDYTAVQPYEVNDLVYVGDTLYIVTSAIAQGATMTPNTNCAETTLNAVIKSLR